MSGVPIWTIYDSPIDHPGRFVARLWIDDQPTVHVRFATRINDLRKRLRSEGYVRLARDPNDDAKIVETWV